MFDSMARSHQNDHKGTLKAMPNRTWAALTLPQIVVVLIHLLETAAPAPPAGDTAVSSSDLSISGPSPTMRNRDHLQAGIRFTKDDEIGKMPEYCPSNFRISLLEALWILSNPLDHAA